MMFKHRIQNSEKLSHTSCQGDLLTLSGRAKPGIETTDYRIKTLSDKSSHIKHCSHVCSATPNSTPTMGNSAIAVEGRYPSQSSYFPPVKSPHFRQLHNKSGRKRRAYSWYSLKQTIFLLPNGVIFNNIFHFTVGIRKLLLKPGNMSFNPAFKTFCCSSK